MLNKNLGSPAVDPQPHPIHHAGRFETEGVQPFRLVSIENDRIVEKDAEIIVESPVSLTINGEVWLTFMCTPIDLEALALGFLFNEGKIKSMEQVAQVHVCAAGDNVDVWLEHPIEKPEKWRRTSGCTGGLTAIETDPQLDNDVLEIFSTDGLSISASRINHLVETLFESQELYRRSGGVHTSILTDGHDSVTVGEDIGRHNTLDKIAGHCLMNSIQMKKNVLITTGRISSEMIQKAARLGASIVISRTSPSSMSIRLAERWGITLIGYARRNRFNVYTHSERVLLDVNQ